MTSHWPEGLREERGLGSRSCRHRAGGSQLTSLLALNGKVFLEGVLSSISKATMVPKYVLQPVVPPPLKPPNLVAPLTLSRDITEKYREKERVKLRLLSSKINF